MTFHYTCCILFVGSKSKNPAHTYGKGITNGSEYQETEITGNHLTGCLTHLCTVKARRYKDTDMMVLNT